MNKQGHLKAGNNKPEEPELKKRTDLSHTIAHATGVTHDCHVKEPPKETEKDLKKTPDVKPINEKELAFDEKKKEQVEAIPPKVEEEAVLSLKKIIENPELRKLVKAILEETEEERKKALSPLPDWAMPSSK
jgi:hypothetical protein